MIPSSHLLVLFTVFQMVARGGSLRYGRYYRFEPQIAVYHFVESGILIFVGGSD